MQETSRDAFKQYEGTLKNLLQRNIYNTIWESAREGMTHEEIEWRYRQFKPSGIRTRVKELVNLGLVVDSGERRILKSTGRKAIVWKIR